MRGPRTINVYRGQEALNDVAGSVLARVNGVKLPEADILEVSSSPFSDRWSLTTRTRANGAAITFDLGPGDKITVLPPDLIDSVIALRAAACAAAETVPASVDPAVRRKAIESAAGYLLDASARFAAGRGALTLDEFLSVAGLLASGWDAVAQAEYAKGA